MIGFLRGHVVKRLEGELLLEAAGVGYQVLTPPEIWERAIEGEETVLFVTTIVREGEISLAGFARLDDKLLFEKLLKVNGVGPRLGLQLIAAFGTEGLRSALQHNDAQLLARAPGIGKKTAERLCLELHDHLPSIDTGIPTDSHQASLVSALTNLGFSEKDVYRVLRSLPLQLKGFDARFKHALQQLHTSR